MIEPMKTDKERREERLSQQRRAVFGRTAFAVMHRGHARRKKPTVRDLHSRG